MSAQPVTERGRRTRDALLVAARAAFEEKGFPQTRMGDIAEAAGVSHGTVWTWFDAKQDVLAAVAEAITSDLYDALRAPEEADPVQRIEVANQRYLDAYRDNARLLEVIEQAATTDPRFRELLAALRRTHVERVATTIRRLRDEGLCDQASRDADLDPHVAAAALCAMVEGFARHWLGRGETHDEETAVAALTEIWVRALGLSRGTTAPRRRGRT